MDQAAITQLLSGGGVLAFASVVYFAVREIGKIQRRSLEILRVIEERTASMDDRLRGIEDRREREFEAPLPIRREQTAKLRARPRTPVRGVPSRRPTFDTDDPADGADET